MSTPAVQSQNIARLLRRSIVAHRLEATNYWSVTFEL